jgi:predicted lipid-binding transport protein (Tim44 family)
MGEGFYSVDILIFALIAGFLVYRLYTVLGQRHDEERPRPNPFATDRTKAPLPSNVVPLPDRARPQEPPARASDETYSVSAGLTDIRNADPSFDEKHFVRGARSAFERIVGAYAEGDTATLRPLLSDEVYDQFAEEIRRRSSAGEQHEARIERIKDVDLIEARMEGRTALITLRFDSEQVNVVRDRNGEVIDGSPDHVVDMIDLWTFSRNTRARDPNWQLTATRVPG